MGELDGERDVRREIEGGYFGKILDKNFHSVHMDERERSVRLLFIYIYDLRFPFFPTMLKKCKSVNISKNTCIINLLNVILKFKLSPFKTLYGQYKLMEMVNAISKQILF